MPCAPLTTRLAACLVAAAILLVNSPAGAGSYFTAPVRGWVVSGFGWRVHPLGGGGIRHHWGIDIAAPTGTPVVASAPGTVLYTGWHGCYGLVVYIQHAGGWQTLYAHLSRIAVSVGAAVPRAHPVGAVGNTGCSTAPHLHFEIRYRGVPVDPLPYLLARR
jgi:murein DD-endopeptidase MepM/ murein hydrolase activator NlpD